MKPAAKPPRHPKEAVIRAAFARVLVELRERAGLTQAEVGEKAGYEEKYIGALERRKHTPTLTAVIEISKAVDTPALEVLAIVLKLIPRFAHLEKSPEDLRGH
jgi:XRE family transcriptional regulator, regulator of sulfur utilization